MIENIRKSLRAIVFPVKDEKPDLVSALRNLDDIVSNQPGDLHPKLRHFLQNRSYEKALLWIEGGTQENGICQK
jgi:hypothetical protein